jgi:hypothetical protein
MKTEIFGSFATKLRPIWNSQQGIGLMPDKEILATPLKAKAAVQD